MPKMIAPQRMSDPIKHECGIAVVRLRKPLAYYKDKYGSALWGYQKLYMLMMKERNRGQDGEGIGCCKLHMPLGTPYLFRERSVKKDSLEEIFLNAKRDFDRLCKKHDLDPEDPEIIKQHFEFGGEVLMGHLRYGTSGSFGKASCHPYVRRSNWPTKSLMVMGNFNLTNSSELHRHMIERGQHPVYDTDTQTVLEEVGFHLDEMHDELFHELRDEDVPGPDIPVHISKRLDVTELIKRSAEIWDGGYAIVGVIGNGDLFVMRDPNGIRPCFYYADDEVIVFASEKPAIRTVFNASEDDVKELPRASVASIKADNGRFIVKPFTEKREFHPCSFERIYFSRSNDATIYEQRKQLGEVLVPHIIDAIENDLEHTVVSFIPNTAEIAYYGFMDGLRKRRRTEVRSALKKMWQSGSLDENELDELIMRNWPRAEKIAHKDIKMRTFISQETSRDGMAAMVYDITYGVVTPDDNLVVIDDSIVRGTTLRTSLLRILARTNPKRIVIVSTAPQIRYPDCYGIDMAELGKFIAFEAAVQLLKDRGKWHIMDAAYGAAKAELKKPACEMRNVVKDIYASFTDSEISAKVVEIVNPRTLSWKGEVKIIYQTIGDLHKAIGPECGDWYFSGDYPTPGGYETVNRAFLNFYEGKGGRAYGETLF
jgi:amidophosphoribosyltransferase